jgi:hypothetical protein
VAPYFPAALGALFPNDVNFENVKGIASLKPKSFGASAFTNRGRWVRGSAVGEQVASTFIPVGPVHCEDASSDTPMQTFSSSWALWQGTSFAAPRVAAAVAARLSPTVDPSRAWAALTATAAAEDPQLGHRFTQL